MKTTPRYALAISAILALPLYAHAQANGALQESQFESRAKTMHLLGTFRGTTPCADCPGIVTTLTLYTKAPYDYSEAIYKLHLQYIDRGSFTSYGSWSLLRGRPGDDDATVYELDSDKPDSKQYYLRVDENTLQQLDRDMKPIQSTQNFTLKRIRGRQVTHQPKGL